MTEKHASSDPRRGRILRAGILPALAALSLALAGCSSSAAFRLEKTLPGADAVAGWKPDGEVQTYNRETLFDYIDGASEYFFTYTFEAVAVRNYENTAASKIRVEVWQLSEAQDAYGLFSGRETGEPVAIGGANAASLETGSRLVFWQSRFYISITALDTVPDDDLRLFGEFVSGKLPAGGEPPPLISRLPADGLVPSSVKFFHKEMAVQDRLWLGGENLLGLGPETDAALARYRMGDAEWQLLLVEYPDTAQAEAGRRALENGAAEDFITAGTSGALLGAVFGKGGGSSAEALLAKALGN